MDAFPPLLDQALTRRRALLERLAAEQTDAYRLFHGVSEGRPGLTIDRYGPLVLAQTFREPLTEADIASLEAALRQALPGPFAFAYNHRGRGESPALASDAAEEKECRELGVKFLVRARHPGIDPWLFLDLRAGRRHLRNLIRGQSLLNLFSYTCGAGVTAAAAGASEVWNVDFAASNLAIGERNARLNAIPTTKFHTIQEDCLPVLRQLAGLPAGGRIGKTRKPIALEPRSFDVVFLDPPAWSKGPFGAVDVANDYASLFKPAVLIARPGGRVIATNHLASVSLEAWKAGLERCAAKAGRPIRSMTAIVPDEDFPSFDGRPPLKIFDCEV
jgi:23S rRNA (cytosine1962-C5)-methyltransferase